MKDDVNYNVRLEGINCFSLLSLEIFIVSQLLILSSRYRAANAAHYRLICASSFFNLRLNMPIRDLRRKFLVFI